jgi:uncharacterized phage-like protein YoqJ
MKPGRKRRNPMDIMTQIITDADRINLNRSRQTFQTAYRLYLLEDSETAYVVYDDARMQYNSLRQLMGGR